MVLFGINMKVRGWNMSIFCHCQSCSAQWQVAIRVLDQAGGIPFHAADKVWSYMYSTASKVRQNPARKSGKMMGPCNLHQLYQLDSRDDGEFRSVQFIPRLGRVVLFRHAPSVEARKWVPQSSFCSWTWPIR
jgi:hypothetical protein